MRIVLGTDGGLRAKAGGMVAMRPATEERLGGIIVGDGLEVTPAGVLSVSDELKASILEEIPPEVLETVSGIRWAAETIAAGETPYAEAETTGGVITVTLHIPAGADGSDGVSPTVSVSKVGKVTTITITDKNGTHTATITDGADGQGTGDMLAADYDAGSAVRNAGGIAAYVTGAALAKDAKVTSLSASSTDEQVPSAKCVWDMIGDVESTLEALL